MSEIKNRGVGLNLGLIYPLGGILVAYALVLTTTYVDLVVNVQQQKANGDNFGNVQYLHPYTYFLLLAVAILIISSLVGRRVAGARLSADPTLRINRNVYAFTTITMMSSLIAAVIYAIAIYFSNIFGSVAPPAMRLLQLYVPIVLDAALLIFGILRAFVVKPKGASK